ncbi:hypothetical protein DPMN_103260 [Dreissena polymorpha]|uniref:NTR domain-containing protein n=1 Tax=Dreissena polymorpha TaxID=45954 RepID=A0A9D4H9H3_DREPO|nr:hypothetical protein DPMN_103260 [Dreissena polymorpha]
MGEGILGWNGLSECCRCAVRPDLDLGCASDFIIKTKVTSQLRNHAVPNDSDSFYYMIKQPCYVNTYKFNFRSDVSAANKARVYNSESTGSCGVFLERGKTYILSGSVN